jgi:hypothetical protein
MENIFVQCPPGYYDPDNYFSCQPCPEGKVCPVMTHQYIENNGNNGWVQDGFFSPMGTHVELRTPAGWYVQTTTFFKEVRPCPLGYYSLDGAINSCTICDEGYMCPYGSNVPILCPEGSSAEDPGMHECIPCSDDNWYNPATKTCDTVTDDYYTFHPIFAQQNCVYNQRSSSSTFGNFDYVDCIAQDGQYYIKSSNSYGNCPSGFYCMEQGQASAYIKIPCPPGTYTAGSSSYQKIEDACILCEAGNYCPGGDNAKTTCPAGYICPEGTQFATQFPCPLFSLNAATGASTYGECTTCVGGGLCLEGTSAEFACPPGEDCSQAPWNGGDCESGTYSNGGCHQCPQGEWCPTSSSYGMKCPSGTYASGTGSKSAYTCDLAPVNSPIPKYGQSATPSDYPT